MNKHVIEMDEEEWQEYILDAAKKKLMMNNCLTDIKYKTEIDPLRIIKMENGLIELGFIKPPSNLEVLSNYVNYRFADDLSDIFTEILHENYAVKVKPVYVNE